MKFKFKLAFILIMLIIFAIHFLTPAITLEEIEENGIFCD